MADNSITYAGYQNDDETGLYYVNARYYDSITAHLFLVGALVDGVMEYVDQKFIQKKEHVDWKAVGYESLMGGALATLSVVTGGVGTTAVTSTVAKSAGKSALKTAAKSTVKNVVKTTFKKTAKKAVKNTMKSTVKKVAKTAIKTGVSEAAQGFVSDVGRQVVVDGKSLDEVDYGQAAMTASISGAFGMVGGMTSSVAKTAKANVKSKVAKYTNKVAKRVDDVVAKADDTVQAAVKKTKVGSVASKAGTGSKSRYVSSVGSVTGTGAVNTNKVKNSVTKVASANIHPSKLAAESSEVNQASIMRMLRKSGTDEGQAVAKLLKRGNVKLNIEEIHPKGWGGQYKFGDDTVSIYTDIASNPQRAAGYTAHEVKHYLQDIDSTTYRRIHEFEAFTWQRRVDKSFGLRDSSEIWNFINTNKAYEYVRK